MNRKLPQFHHILFILCILPGTIVQGQPTFYGLGLGSSFDEALELGFDLMASNRSEDWHYNRFRTAEGHDLALTYFDNVCVFLELDYLDSYNRRSGMPFTMDFGTSMLDNLQRLGFLGYSYENAAKITTEEGIVHFSCYEIEEYSSYVLCLVYLNKKRSNREALEVLQDNKLYSIILSTPFYLERLYGEKISPHDEYRPLKWRELF